MMKEKNEVLGKKFNSWTVLDRVENKNGEIRYFCRCDCGIIKILYKSSFVCGSSKQCNDCSLKSRRKTNKSKNPQYYTWKKMIDRCENIQDKRYKNYGGRGIKVSDDWHIFEKYIMDIGERPSKIHTIDRINNDGNYCKENFKWSTPRQQSNNRSNNKYIFFNGEKFTLSQMAQKLNIRKNVFSNFVRLYPQKDAIKHFQESKFKKRPNENNEKQKGTTCDT